MDSIIMDIPASLLLRNFNGFTLIGDYITVHQFFSTLINSLAVYGYEAVLGGIFGFYA